MHPNTFIDQLWNGTETDHVFVAMSFAQKYDARYNDIFRPAIEAIRYRGTLLSAYRVDESKSGDSIITEIIRKICESRLVLADVSDLLENSNGDEPVRNGNVMYEVGLAHAVKSPEKVLIVRDDSKRLLFDLSSIPHVNVDFSSIETARVQITELLLDRFREVATIDDIKVRAFIASISDTEVNVLLRLYNVGKIEPIDLTITSSSGKVLPNPVRDAIVSLRDAGLVRSHVTQNPFNVLYSLTERGQSACITLVRDLNNSRTKS